ncbi:endonuclease/exonuclease/phosphatase family protein, partial [Kineococcus glutinatus]|uniref:endonuclease/exonuclease/phosphatase family protein n=1 Tax=Kineococcus glutinatus TaxID=1070872 RepID=UPI0031E98C90
MASRVPRTVLAAEAALGAASALGPSWFGLDGTRPWLYAAALRVPVTGGLAEAAVLAGAVGLASRGGAGRLARPVAAVLAVSAVLSGAVVLHRGAGAGHLPAAQPQDVTVVTANTLHSHADPEALAAVVVRAGADVVTMPETTRQLAEEVAAAVLARGGPALQVFTREEVLRGSGQTTATSLLVSDRWGAYRQQPADELRMTYGAVAAVPVAGDGPPLAAVHPVAPVGDELDVWEREGLAAVAWAQQHPGSLVGGDFNATLDHPAFAGLGDGPVVDVGAATGTGARGTWPAKVPALLGSPIDHVLADSRRWRPVASEVVDLPGSDHRAVVARVGPALQQQFRVLGLPRGRDDG